MNQFLKTWGLLITAILIGVVAFFVASVYLSNRESSLRDSILGGVGETREVVVATVDIGVGEAVGAQNMALAEVPLDHLSSAAITPNQFNDYDGAILKVPLSPGEPLLEHSVEGVLIERFSELLEQGQRAVTIEVNTLTSNAGLLAVGDFVDIFLSGSFEAGDNPGEDTLTPLFQQIKILAVDRYPLLTKEQRYRAQSLIDDENELEYSSVTLRLESNSANRLAYASSIGEIVFLLRNAEDNKRVGFDVLTTQNLLAGSGKANGSAGTYLYRSQAGAVSKPISDSAPLSNTKSDVTASSGREIKMSVRLPKTLLDTEDSNNDVILPEKLDENEPDEEFQQDQQEQQEIVEES